MLHFQLFRIKVQPPVQPSLLYPDQPSQIILKSAILEKPSAELRKNHTWHIGNISQIDQDGLYLALGRTTSSIVERYDLNKGDFIEEEFETAPYTHTFVDLKLGVCAIAAKSKLAPTIRGIAFKLGKLLDNSQIAKDREFKFEISEINDPEDFIGNLKKAYAIRKFAMTFTLPNPFDVNQDFQAPMEKLLKETSGEEGKTAISGPNLNPAPLVELARSAAASGNDADANMQLEENQKPMRKRLRGNPVTIDTEVLDSSKEKRGFFEKVRSLYNRVRNKAGTEQ